MKNNNSFRSETHAPRRRLLIGAAAAMAGAALPLAGARAAAGAYPARPIVLIVPFAAGGPTDVLARVIAEGMSKDLGQPIIVENTPGAGGTVGTARAARMPGDGHAVLIGNVGTLAANATLYKKLPYDILKDFIPLGSVGDAPQVLSARKDLAVSGLDEFAAYARAHAKEMNFGAAGVGSGSFLGGILLNERLGLKINAVNYRGAGQALNDVMAGHLDYLVDSSTTSVGYVNSGMVRGVAVLRARRIAALPDVPAAGESSFADLHYDIWNMMLVPAGTPAPIVARLNQALRTAVAAPATRERLSGSGIEAPSDRNQTPDGAAELLATEVHRWAPILAKLNISVN
ncbi:Bug family tripartite tricarboxylate transporter substrate binding protein [Bordetella bronchialis]|nr:tripartite tricarboxylate transporter substrate-binding protein [Bordetella bronchialis]